MLKCSSERWVWAPQSLSAGTSTSPRLSVSLRMSVMSILLSSVDGSTCERASANARLKASYGDLTRGKGEGQGEAPPPFAVLGLDCGKRFGGFALVATAPSPTVRDRQKATSDGKFAWIICPIRAMDNTHD